MWIHIVTETVAADKTLTSKRFSWYLVAPQLPLLPVNRLLDEHFPNGNGPVPVERNQTPDCSIPSSTSIWPGISFFVMVVAFEAIFFLAFCFWPSHSVSQEIRFYSRSRFGSIDEQPSTVTLWCSLARCRGEYSYPKLWDNVNRDWVYSLSGVACDHPWFVCL